jgi:hypothetical protein
MGDAGMGWIAAIIIPRRCEKRRAHDFQPRAFQKVKLRNARHLVEITIARQLTWLQRCFGTLGNTEAIDREVQRQPQFRQRMKYI